MSRNIWRRQLRSWLPPLLVFLVALTGLGFYRLVFAGEARAGGRRIERQRSEVKRLTQERRRSERLVARLSENQKRIEEFRGRRLATEAERLTELIATPKSGCRGSG